MKTDNTVSKYAHHEKKKFGQISAKKKIRTLK